jgi:endogenous inhibitor of DNA gyrase (YacG/DUF329 family)
MARCPICEAVLPEKVKTFPFCGERCRLIDLGNWLGGSYRVAGEESAEAPREDDEQE